MLFSLPSSPLTWCRSSTTVLYLCLPVCLDLLQAGSTPHPHSVGSSSLCILSASTGLAPPGLPISRSLTTAQLSNSQMSSSASSRVTSQRDVKWSMARHFEIVRLGLSYDPLGVPPAPRSPLLNLLATCSSSALSLCHSSGIRPARILPLLPGCLNVICVRGFSLVFGRLLGSFVWISPSHFTLICQTPSSWSLPHTFPLQKSTFLEITFFISDVFSPRLPMFRGHQTESGFPGHYIPNSSLP